MSLEQRLHRLEAVTTAATCPTCAAWGWRVVNDVEPSPYDLEQRRNEPPGPSDWPATCPDCGRAIPTISVIHVDSATWRERSAL